MDLVLLHRIFSSTIGKHLVNILVLMKTVKLMLPHIWHHFRMSLSHFVHLFLNYFQCMITRSEKVEKLEILKSETL